VFSRKRRETEDGFELHFAVNHLGVFRLSSFIYMSSSNGGSSFQQLHSQHSPVSHEQRRKCGKPKPPGGIQTTQMGKYLLASPLNRRLEQLIL